MIAECAVIVVANSKTDCTEAHAQQVDQISAAAEEITRHIEDIASITQKTASGSKEAAGISEGLKSQADDLMQIVDQFRTE
jgi:methyl-accepting chemotaxis protein